MNKRGKNTLSGCTITILVLVAALGQTQEVETDLAVPLDSMKFSTKFNGGLASAVGLFGVSVGYSPMPMLEVEGGVGYGFSGVQASLMPRLSFGSAAHRFVMGAGISISIDLESQQHIKDASKTSLWANLDMAGYELRLENGFVFSIAAGLTIGLAGRFDVSSYMADGDNTDTLGVVAPQARIGIGFWL